MEAQDLITELLDCGLPPLAFIDNREPGRIVHNTSAAVIAVKRGERGFYPLETPLTADELNREYGVTPAQREAMFAGSMFGFDCPAAMAENYSADGVPLRFTKAVA